jgi:hypothetical protein
MNFRQAEAHVNYHGKQLLLTMLKHMLLEKTK